MRARTKVVSFALCALMMFGFAITAQAQIVHSVTQQNNEVVQYGLTELMGEVRLTMANSVATSTTPSTITITYLGAQINNVPAGTPVITLAAGIGTLTFPNGVSLTVTGNYATNFLTSPLVSINVINTALGGQVVLSIPTAFSVNIGDQIRVNGARTDVSAKAIGATIGASISSTPSNANLFDQVNVTVATVNKSMDLTVTPKTIPICTVPTNPSVRVTEGFSGAFVEYTTGAANPRPRFGATGDTRVRIQVNNLPSGVSLAWPTSVVGTTLQGIGVSAATLVLESGSTSSVAIYTYTTTNQGTSDNQKETFLITPVVTVPLTSGFGQSTAQVQLWPDATSTTIIRFAHPLINDPPDNFLAITKCVTYLLYPFVTGNAIPGFTTGISVANTSADDAAFGGTGTGAVAQSGAITFFGWQNSTKNADGSSTTTLAPPFAGTSPVTAIVSTNLSAGDTWAGVIDAAAGFSGFQGYIIAKCDFQFAHGFAFIVGKYNSGSVFDVAHGYIALVIPDPAISFITASNLRETIAGESLGQ